MVLGAEPVALAAVIRTVILAGVAFGLGWTVEQIAALMLAVEAILAVLTRQAVTPVAEPKLEEGASVNRGSATVTPNS